MTFFNGRKKYFFLLMCLSLFFLRGFLGNVKHIFSLFEESSLYYLPENSEYGVKNYAQGVIARKGLVYASSDDKVIQEGKTLTKSDFFPRVVAFDAFTGKKKTQYPFKATYDSAPLILENSKKETLIIAHEYLKKRTKAYLLHSKTLEWVSPANEPGNYFFGYSYFINPDNSKTIYIASANGLHALSSETGKELWFYQSKSSGGCTPAVFQKKGGVFYQTDKAVLKLSAHTGKLLAKSKVKWPYQCYSSNTVLKEIDGKKYILTYWYGKDADDSAIRVFDEKLDLVWEKAHLPLSKKNILTTYDNNLVVGGGNQWNENYIGSYWKRVSAYRIQSGEEVWHTDLSQYDYQSIAHVIYYNQMLYAVTQDRPGYSSKVFRLSPKDGHLLEYLDFGRAISSCAPPIIAYGHLYNGDLWQDKMVVVKVAEDHESDWPSVFYDPQTNVYGNFSVKLHQSVKMREKYFND